MTDQDDRIRAERDYTVIKLNALRSQVGIWKNHLRRIRYGGLKDSDIQKGLEEVITDMEIFK